MPSSSKSSEDCSQSSSYKSINSSISDKMSGTSSQHAVEDNSNNASPKLVQSENASTKEYYSKLTLENKMKTDSSGQSISKFQPTYSPPINSQQMLCTTDANQQTTSTLGLPKSESTKNIDLSTLSSVLDDGKNKEEESTVMSNEIIEEKSTCSSDHKPQNTRQNMSNIYYIRMND